MKYYLKRDWETRWREVSKKLWIKTEHRMGLRPNQIGKDTLATSGFNVVDVAGRIDCENGEVLGAAEWKL